MGRKETKYFHQYSQQELEKYSLDPDSCVKYVKTEMHIGFPPWGLRSFRKTLTSLVKESKIGSYDNKLGGIVMDIRNIKVLGNQFPIFNEHSNLHIDLLADLYIFVPTIGKQIKGIITNIGQKYITVTIYQNFNVTIELKDERRKYFKMNSEILVNIKSLDLERNIPFIEGVTVDHAENGEFRGKQEPENTLDSGVSTCSPDAQREMEQSSSESDSTDSDTKIHKAQKKIKQENRSSKDSSSEDENDQRPTNYSRNSSKAKVPATTIKQEKNGSSSEESSDNESDISSSYSDSSLDSDSSPEVKRRKKNDTNVSNHVKIKTDIDDLPNTSAFLSPQLSSTKIAKRQTKKKTTAERANELISKFIGKNK